MSTAFKSMLPGLFLFVAQAPIAGAIFVAAAAAAHHWNEVLEGCQLPLIAQWALDYGIAIPVITAVLSLILVDVGWRRKSPGYCLLFTISACEAVALAVFALALMLPGLEVWLGSRR